MSILRYAASDLLLVARETARVCRRAGREAVVRRLPPRMRTLDRLGLVPREEFDAVRELAEKAQLENEMLAERVAKLEAGTRKRAPRKPRASKGAEAAES